MMQRRTLAIGAASVLLVGGGGVAAAAAAVNGGGGPEASCMPKHAVSSGNNTVSFDVHCSVRVPRTTVTAPGSTATVVRTVTAAPTGKPFPSHPVTSTLTAPPTSTATSTASPTRTGSPSPTSTSTGTPSPTSTANPPTALGSCSAMPTAANTGASGKLGTYHGKNNITTAGAVIQNVQINGDVTVDAPNVKFKNVRITGGGGLVVHRGGDGTTIDHVTSDDGMAISSAKNVTIEWSTVVAAKNDALHVTSDDGRHVSGAKILYNYLPAPSKALIGTSAHFDGLQVRGSDNMLIHCNNWRPGPFSAFGPKSNNVFNGDVYLENANGGNHNVIVDSNWLYDSGISLRVQAITGAQITNNHFGGKPAYGFIVVRAGAQITKSSGNVDDDNGKALKVPAPS